MNQNLAMPAQAAGWQRLLKLAFWLALATIIVLSLMPMNRLPSLATSIWDKGQHALAFAVLAVLALLSWPRSATARVMLGLLIAGVGVELAQAALGWRSGEWQDVLADAVGLVLGWALLRLGQRFTSPQYRDRRRPHTESQ